NLTFYLPFVLAWLWMAAAPRWARVAGIALTTAAIIGYVILSEERSSFVGLVCALICLGILVLRTHPLLTIAFVSGVIVLAVVLNGEALLRNLSKGEDSFSQLDA